MNKFSYNEHLHQEWLKMVFTCPLILQYLVQKFRFSFLTVSYKTYKRINIATSLFADCESSFRGTTTIYSLAWLALHAWIRNSCTRSNVEIVTKYVKIVVTYLPNRYKLQCANHFQNWMSKKKWILKFNKEFYYHKF